MEVGTMLDINLNCISLKEWDHYTLKVVEARNKFNAIVNDIIDNNSFRVISKKQGEGVLMMPLQQGIDMFEELENLKLANLALERKVNFNLKDAVDIEDVEKRLGL